MRLKTGALRTLSGYPTIFDSYRVARVEGVSEETPRIRTFTFRDERCSRAKPGQYVMVWVQGVDEIPLSLSAINHGGLSSVTVEKVGEATAALYSEKMDNPISVRGPYGNFFQPVRGSVLVVAGGVGVAPLLPLTEDLVRLGSDVTLVVGAKKRGDIVSLTTIERLLKGKGKLIFTTEDGSYGLQGLATSPADELIAEGGLKMVYTCGPERMMRHVFDSAEESKVPVQACLERVIRCSMGLCGSCVVGGFRVCRDGPIFSSEQMRSVLDEFGVYKRDFDGSRLPP